MPRASWRRQPLGVILWPVIVTEQVYWLVRHPDAKLIVADAAGAVSMLVLLVVARMRDRRWQDRLTMAMIVVLGIDAATLLVWMLVSEPASRSLTGLLPFALLFVFWGYLRWQIRSPR